MLIERSGNGGRGIPTYHGHLDHTKPSTKLPLISFGFLRSGASRGVVARLYASVHELAASTGVISMLMVVMNF